ncbi:MAG: hypothetical protein ACJ8LG_01380 [Massilia sp.]
MKKQLLTIVAAILLAGCAASAYKTARSNANLVRNGMTIQQAADILGIPPSHQTGTAVEWRRGNAQFYDATPSGAIKFQLKDGVIVDVPEGGVFGPEARRRYIEVSNALRAEQEARDREGQARAAAEAERAKAAREAKAVADAEQAEAERKAEELAAAAANVPCNEKSTCAKVFSLAQIYIATHADQKIQVVTDTIIQTYNPTEVAMVGATIMKMPKKADAAVVTLSLSCNTGEFKTAEGLCRGKKTEIYKGFRPFVETRLAH